MTRTSAERPAAVAASGMSHGQILESMTGLMLSMFVAMLSSTVVSNALPRILHDLHGGESAYTWVVTATLLATTTATPLWGKLSDLISKKLLMQLAIAVFITGSVVAGLSQNIGMLIACRVVQGVGAGGILAMTQVIMAAMVSPRERGRYSGYLGATFAVATIAGPLIGGVIVDTSWLGWRWCFYVGVPFAAAALVVLQRTLHLPVVTRELKVDYLGAALITGGVSLLLVWVSLAGQKYDWVSGTTALMVAGGLLLLAVAAWVELRVDEPIIPLELFRHRTVGLATAAGLFLGVAMFGATIFLAQYFQIARGESPTASGLRTMPMILGLAVASLVTGRLVSRTGYWKRYLVTGSITATVGFFCLGTIDARTSFTRIAVYMALVGIGLGMTTQNLV
ncbi:MAG: major facilitator superfamily mfs 1, partial [Frankiales bacterium]|nr:major facilitator superfamily mfs 1 [Frankiales bacterium]